MGCCSPENLCGYYNKECPIIINDEWDRESYEEKYCFSKNAEECPVRKSLSTLEKLGDFL